MLGYAGFRVEGSGVASMGSSLRLRFRSSASGVCWLLILGFIAFVVAIGVAVSRPNEGLF